MTWLEWLSRHERRHRRLIRFLLAGGAGTLLDFVVYRAAIWLTGHIDVSKTLGMAAGITLSYFANKNWTFGFGSGSWRSLAAFIALYSFSGLANVAANHVFFACLPVADFEARVVAAFCLADLSSAAINYLGMKWLVFARKPGSEREPGLRAAEGPVRGTSTKS